MHVAQWHELPNNRMHTTHISYLRTRVGAGSIPAVRYAAPSGKLYLRYDWQDIARSANPSANPSYTLSSREKFTKVPMNIALGPRNNFYSLKILRKNVTPARCHVFRRSSQTWKTVVRSTLFSSFHHSPCSHFPPVHGGWINSERKMCTKGHCSLQTKGLACFAHCPPAAPSEHLQ